MTSVQVRYNQIHELTACRETITNLRIEIADQQDRVSSRDWMESQSGGPREGQRGQGSGQSGDRKAWIGGGHWES